MGISPRCVRNHIASTIQSQLPVLCKLLESNGAWRGVHDTAYVADTFGFRKFGGGWLVDLEQFQIAL